MIGKYYKPIKTAVSVRIDNEVLDWLKSQGAGYLSRINEILRGEMLGSRSRVADYEMVSHESHK